MSDALKHAVQRRTEGHNEAAASVVAPVPGLRLIRRSTPGALAHTGGQPLLCLVLQGGKRVAHGSSVSSHAAGDTMILAGNRPTVSRIHQASAAQPYLALALDLEPAVITDLVMTTPAGHSRPATLDTGNELRDALRRLVLLLDRPESLAVLKDGLIREIHHWLLLDRHGLAVRHLGLLDSRARRIAAAVATLRANFAKPLRLERLAASAGMSRSGFHQHFRALTALTPLQFQKQLRLIEARRLIVSGGKALCQVAFDVGYESASQFSREYTRMHGRPPSHDRRTASARRGTQGAAE